MPLPDQQRKVGETIPPGEQGMTLPLALIIGALLLIASAGLVAKLILLKSAGAAESYKQIAELASSNGISRILSKLNDSQSVDISYLWRLSQDLQLEPVGTPLRQWDLADPAVRTLMEQPCTPLSLTAETRAILQGGDMTPGMNLRSDGRPDPVGMSYRLRSYSYSPGDSKATFTVEGYATQGSGNNQNVLARSLLTRVLELKRVVRSDDDWGVIAARNLSLGPTSIAGQGKVLWLMDVADASRFGVGGSCTPASLGAAVASSNASTQSKLWPVVGSDFPSPGLFDQLATIDQVTGSATPQRRIWHIDDKRGTTCSGASPGTGASGEGICVRGEASATWSSGETTASVKRSGGAGSSITSITLHADNICPGTSTSQPCLIWIESIQLRNGATVSIETANGQGARPVILRLLRPQESINIVNGRLCQANYTTSATSTLPCSSDAKAENLAIVASNGDNSNNCTTATQNLKFGGSGLPAALILMPQGTVSINAATTMNGLIWARNICANSGINLSTNNPDGSSIIRAFKSTWKWDNNLTFGRTITRGIRGTGLDLFRRW